MDNRLGCNTLYPNGRLGDAKEQFDLEAHRQALRDLAEAGFQCVEFSHPEALSPDGLASLPAECESLGLTPWSAHSWVALPSAVKDADEALPKLRDGIDNTYRLAAEVMVVHAAGNKLDMTQAENRRTRADALNTTIAPLAEYASSKGIVIAIENCGPLTDLELLVEVVGALNLPNVGFNIDTGHAVLHGLDIADAIRLMGSRLMTTHLQDNFGERDDHLPPGEGTIDWGPVFEAFREIGYTRTLMVEISDCPPGREPVAKDDIGKAYRNLRRLLSE